MQEMIYQNKWLTVDEAVILERDSYKGYEYFVVSYGRYPCAYIALKKGQPFYNALYEDVDIHCHGGCTFAEWGYKNLFDETYKVIGWDYGHFNDFLGIYNEGTFLNESTRTSLNESTKKWTTEEMIQECEHVIDQLYFLEHPELIYK